MKRILAIALCATLAIFATACSSSGDSGKSSGSSAASSSAAQESEYYDVAVSGVDVVTDSQGNDAVVVAFDYTNKTNTAVNFMQAIPTAVAQDGVAIGQNTYITDYTGTDGVTPDYMVKVEPGGSTTVHMAFTLTSRNDITVRCSLGFVDGGYPDMNKVLLEENYSL